MNVENRGKANRENKEKLEKWSEREREKKIVEVERESIVKQRKKY